MLVETLLAREGIVVHAITSRVKAKESLERKVSVPGRGYRVLSDVTDVCGVRITTYFQDDVDRVASVIAREFDVDPEHSIDKRAAIDPDRFGYISLHHVVRHTGDRTRLAEYRPYAHLPLEIQTRSILQHAWAEIEHDLGYKAGSALPRGIRRQFSRLAGLLELADQEFAAIRTALKAYEAEVPAEIAQRPDEVLIDQASVEAYVAISRELGSIDKAIADGVGARLIESTPQTRSNQALTLLAAGIVTIGDLDARVKRDGRRAIEFAKRWIQRPYPELSRGIGLLYIFYVALAEWDDRERISHALAGLRFADSDSLATKVVALAKEIRKTG